MQITRYTSLNDRQLLGCASAFIDALFGSLNSAIMYLRKLEGQPKGAAFAFEMSLDQGRYGAMLILERWLEFANTFSPHAVGTHASLLADASRRVVTAGDLLERTNRVLDAATVYSPDVVAACAEGYRALQITFDEEHAAVEREVKLGPMLSEDFKEYRRVFLGDLAAR